MTTQLSVDDVIKHHRNTEWWHFSDLIYSLPESMFVKIESGSLYRIPGPCTVLDLKRNANLIHGVISKIMELNLSTSVEWYATKETDGLSSKEEYVVFTLKSVNKHIISKNVSKFKVHAQFNGEWIDPYSKSPFEIGKSYLLSVEKQSDHSEIKLLDKHEQVFLTYNNLFSFLNNWNCIILINE